MQNTKKGTNDYTFAPPFFFLREILAPWVANVKQGKGKEVFEARVH